MSKKKLTSEASRNLQDAIDEAQRFIGFAKKAISDLEDNRWSHFYSKPHASAKRSSMDLSNALVKIRK